MLDVYRMKEAFKPPPAVVEKKIGVAIAILSRCAQHLLPVTEVELMRWGLTPAIAENTVAADLARDSLSVRRRVRSKGDGSLIVGFAGPLAASIATDDRWIEAALRSAAVPLSGFLQVDCLGENVVVVREKDDSLPGHTAKELRAITKAWGLPEPRIAFNYSKTTTRVAYGVGGIAMEGDV